MKRLVPFLLLGCAAPPCPPGDMPRPPWLLDVSEVEAEILAAKDGHEDFAFCEYVATVTGFDASRAQLEFFPEDHRGCGRCARHFYRVFVTSHIDDESSLLMYVEFMSAAFFGHDAIFLTAFRLEQALSRLGQSGSEACRYSELSLGRFETEGALRTAWAAAENAEEEPDKFLDIGDHPFADLFEALRDEEWGEVEARRIAELLPDTPFADAAMYLAALRYALDGRSEDALRIAGKHRAAVLHMCGLYRRQLIEAPDWIWDLESRVELARQEFKEGRDEEALRDLWPVIDTPPLPSLRIASARSDAGEMLARYYERKQDWIRAIQAWQSWRISTGWCGTGAIRKESLRVWRIFLCMLSASLGCSRPESSRSPR